jgi:hypothetical protein
MTLADEPSPRDTPDRVFRRSLRHPEHLRAFLQQAAPDLAAGFVFERGRLLDREFPWTTGGGARPTCPLRSRIASAMRRLWRWSAC